MAVDFRKLIIITLLLFSLGNSTYAQNDTSGSDQISILTGGEYKLSPGDVVSVTVFGEPDISVGSVRVPLSGVYNYPLIGELNLLDQTTASLAKVLESKLRAGFLSDPKVSVNIVQYRPVIVTGSVNNAGAINYQEGMTVRILSALAQVDMNSLDMSGIKIQRNSSTFNPSNLDSPILPGDIISFQAPINKSDYYYIYGEVNRSGKYEYEDGLTIEQAIIIAGGYTPFASKRNIKVRHSGVEDTVKAKLHETVEPGDVITIKKRWF